MLYLAVLVKVNWVWWCTVIILTLRRMRQKDREFEANLGYKMRPYFKTNRQTNKQTDRQKLQYLEENIKVNI